MHPNKYRPHIFPARIFFLRILTLAAIALASAAGARADTISGTVKDPSGAVVAGAKIEISGGDLANPVVVLTDSAGNFNSPDLKPGNYTVRVTSAGFEEQSKEVQLQGSAQLHINLVIAGQKTSVVVPGKGASLANSDDAYRQLRNIGLKESVICKPSRLSVDAATFEFTSGTLTFLDVVNGAETGMVFVGQGHFSLKPVGAIDARDLARRAGGPTAEEDFTEIVFRFTPDVLKQFAPQIGEKTSTPPEAANAFHHWRERMRHRHEVPEGFTQDILEGETIDNVDADVLAAVYNPKHPAFINAYMRGSPHKDLRFFVRTRVGALPQLDSSEEVALINADNGGMDDGIWYSSHLKSELLAHKASSIEDRRLFATHHYKIETVVAKNQHLDSIATITFEPLIEGERVMKFALLPNLRVSRVIDETGQDLHFVQENRKEDGSFYVILDTAPEMGKERSLTVAYTGDKVLQSAGTGSYYVGARESWYPNLNGFGEKALYDLTFKVPHNNKVISVGKLQSESTEQGFAVTHWITPIPVAVAGFNYGAYQRIDIAEPIDNYKISGYYLTDLPDSLAPYRDSAFLSSMSPASMTKYALEQARAQMEVCTLYFGKGPYEDLYVTEQPNFSFGQSWPSLVFLPISAYIDSTQRWMLFGKIDNKFTGFVQEVTPHEVAHQWWGHGVGWASYHDQWLSEGFAEFSAGLFLQQAVGKKWQKDYLEFWERQRVRILEKNEFGVSPNDAGPLWLGLRLISPRTARAYQGLTYPKGAYVLQMLRSLMYADQTEGSDKEKDFIAMMHDFVDTHRILPASTESFKAIAEKHMTKQMDLQGNGRLDWFFNEWVYGTQVPRYEFQYEIQPADNGKTRVHMKITQSEVDQNFGMLIPIFADFGSGMARLGQVLMVGNSTRTIDYILPNQPKKVALNAYKDILAR